jgi:ketosteroid isomerase-like protein
VEAWCIDRRANLDFVFVILSRDRPWTRWYQVSIYTARSPTVSLSNATGISHILTIHSELLGRHASISLDPYHRGSDACRFSSLGDRPTLTSIPFPYQTQLLFPNRFTQIHTMADTTPNDELDFYGLLQKYTKGEAPDVTQGPTEDHMHEVMRRYIDALNGSDPNALLELYAENGTLIDPVGGPPFSGKDNIRPFVTSLIAGLGNAKLSAPIRTCIGNKGAMAFTIEANTGDIEVGIKVIDVMHFDAEGKIELMEAHWGVEDLRSIRGDLDGFIGHFTPGKGGAAFEANMRKTLQTYVDSINRKEPSTILDLFVGDGTVEDPAGTAPIRGHKAIGTFLEQGLARAHKITLQTPVRASFARSAAMAFTIEFEMEGRQVSLDTIDVFKFNEEGKVIQMQAYWGKENVKLA